VTSVWRDRRREFAGSCFPSLIGMEVRKGKHHHHGQKAQKEAVSRASSPFPSPARPDLFVFLTHHQPCQPSTKNATPTGRRHVAASQNKTLTLKKAKPWNVPNTLLARPNPRAISGQPQQAHAASAKPHVDAMPDAYYTVSP
jgi:hypothetical protein